MDIDWALQNTDSTYEESIQIYAKKMYKDSANN